MSAAHHTALVRTSFAWKWLCVAVCLLCLGLSAPASAVRAPSQSPQGSPTPQGSPAPQGSQVTPTKAGDLSSYVNNSFGTGSIRTLANKTRNCLENSPNRMISNRDWRQKYTARAVYCMREITEDVTRIFYTKIVSYARPALYAVFTLAMIIFGIKLVAGTIRGFKNDTAQFILRLAVVAFILDQGDLVIDFWFNTTDLLLKLVAGGMNGVFISPVQCPAAATPGLDAWYGIWDKFDCIFGYIVGIGKAVSIRTGILALFFAALWSSIGIMIFVTGISAIIAMLLFMFRSAASVVLSYGALGMLILMLPLFLPLVLFKVTEKYIFDGWISMATAKVVQPAITVVFLFFALAVLETLVFTGSSTYSKYDATTHKIDNYTGNNPPAGYSRVIVPIFEPLGVDPFASEGTKASQLRKNIKENQRLFTLQIPSDKRFFGYALNYCGQLGQHVPSGGDILNAMRVAANTTVKMFTDPARAMQEMGSGLVNAVGEGGKIGFKMMACVYGLGSKIGLSQQFNKFINYMIDLGIPRVNKIELCGGGSAHRKCAMQLITSFAAILIVCGAFIAYANHLPTMAGTITGSKSYNVTLGSPQVFGATIKDRINTALVGMTTAWRASARKGGGGLVSRLGGSAMGGFMGGFFRSEARERIKWAGK